MSVVPITRELLAAFYDKHPYEKPPPELEQFKDKARTLSEKLTDTLPDPPFPAPYRLDDCFWRNRQTCEEIIDNFSRVLQQCKTDDVAKSVMAAWDRLKATEEKVRAVQKENSEQISTEVKKFLPRDFRSKIMEGKNAKREKKREREVANLLKKGGSVTQKYELLLKHQAERRKGLVELGQCKGVFRWLVRHVAGVPKVLLDFAKEINAKLGPMEEQRVRYGPHFYSISELGMEIWVLTYAWAKYFKSAEEESSAISGLVLESVDIYCQELERLACFIGEMFQTSPWFVSPDKIKPIEVDGENGEVDSGVDDMDRDDSDEVSDSDVTPSVSTSTS
ncbi:hypothetical protein BSKO_03366 [Bryopsis sp. KO-2023]|nr:hypothetical protein BSKO_03366 [Bryopsis sp. KO-2023]